MMVAICFLGDTILIYRAGPIGQMSIRRARAAGVSAITSVDIVREQEYIKDK